MTSRRFALAAADHLVTAISLAVWLTRRAATDLSAAGIPTRAEAALGARSHVIPAVRALGFIGTDDRHGLPDGACRKAISPIAQETSTHPSTSAAGAVSRSISSGSQQIPLLVDRVGERKTASQHPEIRTLRLRREGKSLNPNLSLAWSAA